MPILFNNRQQNQSNKIVFGKLPPKSFCDKKCYPCISLSYRIFQVGAKRYYNHLTVMEIENLVRLRKTD